MGVVYIIVFAALLVKAVDNWRFADMEYSNHQYRCVLGGSNHQYWCALGGGGGNHQLQVCFGREEWGRGV